jgi:hypothetical protein
VSPNDVQWWSLVIGLAVFVAVIALTFALRRLRERRGSSTGPSGEFVAERGAAARGATSGVAARSGRRRPAPPPPTGEPRELASAIRSAILRAVAERAPAGWTALVLAPPPHPDRMTWHVHLVPAVALDLRDGRTVTVAPPAATHEWQVAGGRAISVGEGDPEPAPGEEAVAVRVTGPYLTVMVGNEDGEAPVLVARVVPAGDEELPRPRAVATDPRAIQGALREAMELTVGSRMGGTAPTAGYPLGSWRAHERIWLAIGR